MRSIASRTATSPARRMCITPSEATSPRERGTVLNVSPETVRDRFPFYVTDLGALPASGLRPRVRFYSAVRPGIPAHSLLECPVWGGGRRRSRDPEVLAALRRRRRNHFRKRRLPVSNPGGNSDRGRCAVQKALDIYPFAWEDFKI